MPRLRSLALVLALAPSAGCRHNTCRDGTFKVYAEPGCGASAHSECVSATKPCVEQFCGCDGKTVTGCMEAPAPFVSRGACGSVVTPLDPVVQVSATQSPADASPPLIAASTAAFALSGDESSPKTVMDREHFIVQSSWSAVPGRAIGLLLPDLISPGDGVNHLSAASVADRALSFSTAGHNYRAVFIPVSSHPTGRDLTVRTADGGTRFYALVDNAAPRTAPVKGPYAVVELEVNDGEGATDDNRYPIVATKVRPLDGTPGYPASTSAIMEALQARHERFAGSQAADADSILARLATALPPRFVVDRALRTSWTATYATWLPDLRLLRVHFATRWIDTATDQAWTPPPWDGTRHPIERPPQQRVGAELGSAYDVSPDGHLARVGRLPLAAWDVTRP